MSSSTKAIRTVSQWGNRFPLFLQGLAALFVLIEFVAFLVKPHGDFLLHREFGRRLLAHEYLYRGGMHVPYPPFWAVVNAPLSLLPAGAAKSLFLLLGISAVAAILAMLNALSKTSMPLDRDWTRTTATLALLFTCPFLLRDLDDGGQNLVLLALSLGGIYFWTRGRLIGAGASLGAAVALKCTPALLLLYFAWKREWRMASITLAFALLYSLTPILWQGPAFYALHMRAWETQVVWSLTAPNPSVGILGPEKLQNRALRPALARYLMALPPGHPGRFEGRGYIDFGHLSPPAAARVIKLLMLLLLAGVAWTFRYPARPESVRCSAQSGPPSPEESACVLWEGATVLLLMLLVSPITWGQHCVSALPITYLLIRSAIAGKEMPRRTITFLFLIAGLILGTDRLFLGRHFALLLESYHLITLGLLALLIVALAAGKRVRSGLYVKRTVEEADLRLETTP